MGDFSGEGAALLVSEKCNQLKAFKSKSNFVANNTFYTLNYENTIIGKKLLSITFFSPSFRQEYIGSNGCLNFNINIYVEEGILNILIFITGVYKKCNYSSREIQRFASTTEASNSVINHLKSIAKGADEFNELLESDPYLKKSYLKLNSKL
jgi:hypothetical protein